MLSGYDTVFAIAKAVKHFFEYVKFKLHSPILKFTKRLGARNMRN